MTDRQKLKTFKLMTYKHFPCLNSVLNSETGLVELVWIVPEQSPETSPHVMTMYKLCSD